MTTAEKHRAMLARLDTFSHFTDSSIGIPFTRFRFGLDALIGLIPGVGDLAGLGLSAYVLVEAQRAGASKTVKLRMVRNMLIDFFGGLIPVVGDAFDAIYKANTRNTHLLRRYLQKQLAPEPEKTPFPWGTLLWLSLLIAAIAGGVSLLW